MHRLRWREMTGGIVMDERTETMTKSLRQLRRALCLSARILGDVNAITSGDSRVIRRRAKNRIVGRLLGRAGAWGKLWQ